MNFINSVALDESLNILLKCIYIIENNSYLMTNVFVSLCFLKKFISKFWRGAKVKKNKTNKKRYSL